MIEAIKSFFGFGTKPDTSIYKIVDCTGMPSCVGMTTIGKPTVGFPFIVQKDKEFRTLTPLSVTLSDNGYTIETKKLTVKFEKS